MKYVSGRIVRGIYTWLGWSGEVAEPIGSSVPVRAHYFLLALPPMKMEPIMSSETSAIRNQTPGNYPKRNKLHSLQYIFSFYLCLHLRCGMILPQSLPNSAWNFNHFHVCPTSHRCHCPWFNTIHKKHTDRHEFSVFWPVIIPTKISCTIKASFPSHTSNSFDGIEGGAHLHPFPVTLNTKK